MTILGVFTKIIEAMCLDFWRKRRTRQNFLKYDLFTTPYSDDVALSDDRDLHRQVRITNLLLLKHSKTCGNVIFHYCQYQVFGALYNGMGWGGYDRMLWGYQINFFLYAEISCSSYNTSSYKAKFR